jgi:hypothetical protein
MSCIETALSVRIEDWGDMLKYETGICSTTAIVRLERKDSETDGSAISLAIRGHCDLRLLTKEDFAGRNQKPYLKLCASTVNIGHCLACDTILIKHIVDSVD